MGNLMEVLTMKKNTKLLAVLLASLTLSLGACGSKSNSKGNVLPPPTEETQFYDEIYLGLFETKQYNPNSKLSFDVEVDNTSLVEYFDGYFITNMSEGTTTAHFRSSTLEYTVTVNVKKDSTVPDFSLSSENISISKNSNFRIDTSLTYRGVDVSEYRSDLKVTKESNNQTSDFVIEGNSVVFAGLEVGTDSYTIYTEFAGFVLSKRIEVTTKTTEGLVICGHRLTYNNDGPFYSISMYQYNDNKINFAEDITVLKNGTPIPYSSLSINFVNPSILDIDPATKNLLPKSRGDASIIISYQGESITVVANVYKPLIGSQRVEIEDHDFDLDFSVDISGTKRTYTASLVNNKNLEIPGSASYTNVASLNIDNNDIPFTGDDVTYNNGSRIINLKAKIFDINHYEQKMLTITMENEESFFNYIYLINFITKKITVASDFTTYLVQLDKQEKIFGQYLLANDIDFGGEKCPGQWFAYDHPLDYSCGFRGILDGCDHKLSNFKSTAYGFFLQVGNGAVIKNIHFSNVLYASKGESIFGRFVSGITFQNIILDFAPGSVTDDGEGGATSDVGIFASQVFSYCTIIDVTVNAQGYDLLSLFGKNVSSTTYQNVNVYCKSLKYVGANYTAAEGVNVITD